MKKSNCHSDDCIEKKKTTLYMDQLNKIYCAYSHLEERFSELDGNDLFEEMSGAVAELIKRSENQLERLEQLYHLLGQEPDLTQCKGLTRFLEDTFSHIQPVNTSNTMRRSYMSSYLQYINSTLIASFQLLQLAEKNTFVNQKVHPLIDRLFVLAQNENTILFVLN